MTLSQRQRRFTFHVGLLILWAFQQGYEVVLLEAERTKEQQRLYMLQGKSRTLHSQHLKRLAVDLALFIGGRYQQRTEAYAPLGQYWKALDPNTNHWGGDQLTFPDGGHFEAIG